MRDYYDSAGNRIGIAYPNGVSTSYAYDNDPRYRLTSITDSGANMAAFQIIGVSGTCSRNEQAPRRAGIAGKCG